MVKSQGRWDNSSRILLPSGGFQRLVRAAARLSGGTLKLLVPPRGSNGLKRPEGGGSPRPEHRKRLNPQHTITTFLWEMRLKRRRKGRRRRAQGERTAVRGRARWKAE